MEGKGTAAEESSLPGGNGEQDEKIGVIAHGGEIVPMRGAVLPAAGNEPGMSANWERPRVRVDARLLEATLLNLRKRIAAIPLVFDIPGADEVTAERGKLLSQIDDYLLPRVRESAAPLLVALVGSTGAGQVHAGQQHRRHAGQPDRGQAADHQLARPRLPPRRHPLVRGEHVPPHAAPGPPGGPGQAGPRRAAGARRQRGHDQGDRAARHPRHRFGGARALRLRLPVPRRLRPMAVHDQREPVRGRARLGAAAARAGAGRLARRRPLPGAAAATAPSSSRTSARCSTPTASRPRTGS